MDLQEELEKKLSDIGEKERAIASMSLADELGLPYADMKGLPVDPEALRFIPEAISRSSGVALVQISGKAGVAVTLDPRTPSASEEISKIKTSYPSLKLIVVSPSTMNMVWQRYATIKTGLAFETGSIRVDDAALANAKENIASIFDLKGAVDRVPVTVLFETLIAGAIVTQASDIHFEPGADAVRIRYRLDGILHEVTMLDKKRFHRVLSRVKVLSKMKLNVTEAPQDGRFTIHESSVDIEVRVSVLPGEYGETIAMRILDPRNIRANIEDLGMRDDLVVQVKEVLKKPQGMLMTTGPTGSGKTTTLYALLNHINSPDLKIITIEDPIEYHVRGLNQTQVEPTRGYTFSSGLRSIVRQDPDVILVGEIRDLETAAIALQAALTGHMVLSTVHTNDASGTIPRLVDLGVKSETIASAVTVAMGQRLLRRLCEQCKKKIILDEQDMKKLHAAVSPIRERFHLPALDHLTIYGPAGCAKCNGTGYRGRIGVYEVFTMSIAMERLTVTAPPVSDIRELAVKEGMVTLLQDGYLKLLLGVTSVDEIRRVLG